MSDVTKPSDKPNTQDNSNKESLVLAVSSDFILEAIRRIDRELAKLEGVSSKEASLGGVR